MGQYRRLCLDERTCELCNTMEIEDEFHFIAKCPMFEQKRKELFDRITNSYPSLTTCLLWENSCI